MNISISGLLGSQAPFLLLFLALVTFPRTTEAAEKTVSKFQGRLYHAVFTSSSGAIERLVTISAHQNVFRSDPSQNDSLVDFSFNKWIGLPLFPLK